MENNNENVQKSTETPINQTTSTPETIESNNNSSKKIIKKVEKLEDKPFQEFINEYFIPELQNSLKLKGVSLKSLELKQGIRPVVGGECWVLFGELTVGRRFWVTFSSDNIKSQKNITLAETCTEPSLLESFLIDEKKITLKLLLSRLLQRLNGQKWFSNN